MNNFTPLKFEKSGKIKSQKNLNIFNKKFFLIGNLFLVLLIAVFGGIYYYRQTMISTKQKAEEEITSGFCSQSQLSQGWVQCGIGDSGCTFCLRPYKRTCNQVLEERGCGVTVGTCKDVNSPVYIYYCKNEKSFGYPGCQKNDPLPPGVYWDNEKKIIQGKFCGTVQVDQIGTSGNNLKFCSRYDDSLCNEKIEENLTPTNTPIPTNTPTLTPTNTPAPTNTPTPTTPPGQPTNTPAPTNTPTPTEIIVVRATNTPVINSPTSTPIQQIVQAGDIRSSWVFAIPVVIILLGLLL